MNNLNQKIIIGIGVFVVISGAAAYYFWDKSSPITVPNIQPSNQQENIPTSANQGNVGPPPTALTPQTQSTSKILEVAKWRTVKNQQFGYELKMPDNWLSGGYNEGKTFTFRPSEKECGYISSECPYITITVAFNPKQLSAKEFYNNQNRRNYFEQSNNQYKIIQVAGQNALEFNPYITFAGEIDVIIPRGKLFIEFVDTILNEKIRTEMLKSFVFTGDVEEIVASNFNYALEQLPTPQGSKTYQWDSQLVHYDSDGNRNVLVGSVKAAIPELQEKFNLVIGKLSFPKSSKELFFTSFYDGTDAGTIGLYSFDLTTNKFSKLGITRYYAQWGVNPLSPDGLKVASIVDRETNAFQKLFVLYLDQDKIESVVTLQGKETLDKGLEFGASGGLADVKWIDDNTIEYGVFDGSAALESSGYRPLLEKRTVKLK